MTTASEYQTVRYDVDGPVATVTLNRPERLNSFNELMTLEIAEIWRRIRDDDDVRSVVLCGAGERAFCTGLDVKEGPWWAGSTFWAQEDPGIRLGPKQQRLYKPVIAAVHGMAAGGAMYLLNEADIIICSEDATFFDPHASGGLVSALEPVGMLQRGVPLGDVLRWALTGNEERITAATALRLGLVTEVVPRERLRDAAHTLAAEIARRRPDAVQGTVRAIWESLDQMPSVAQRVLLAYTRIGNQGGGPTEPPPRTEPRLR